MPPRKEERKKPAHSMPIMGKDEGGKEVKASRRGGGSTPYKGRSTAEIREDLSSKTENISRGVL